MHLWYSGQRVMSYSKNLLVWFDAKTCQSGLFQNSGLMQGQNSVSTERRKIIHLTTRPVQSTYDVQYNYYLKAPLVLACLINDGKYQS